jgi:hypothetical protein
MDIALQQRLDLLEEIRRLRGEETLAWTGNTIAKLILTSPVFAPHVHEGSLEAQGEQWRQRLADVRLELQLALETSHELRATAPPFWAGDAAPIVLLPVRLETVIEPGSPARLLLRIYPDDIHVDAHDDGLTAAELAAGTRFWTAVWAAGPNQARREAAWAALCASVRPARARWIAERLRPTGPPPTQETPVGTAGPAPVLPTNIAARADSWARPAHTLLLPRRFCAFGFHGGEYRWHEFGAEIVDDLVVSPYASPDRSFFDGPAGWLQDFDLAVAAGMGIVKELPDGPPLDRIVVVGVDDAVDAEEGAKRLAAALTRHRYGAGLGLLPPDTPTNNTPETRSAWAGEPEVAAPFDAAAPLTAETDGARLAGGLGIEPSVLAEVPEAAGSYDRDTATVQRLLWPTLAAKRQPAPFPGRPAGAPQWAATVEPRADSPAMVAELGEHVARVLRAAGPWPTLRVGAQPYGVLPATSLLLWGADDHIESLLVEYAQLLQLWAVKFAGRTPRRGVPREVTEFTRTAFGLAPPPEAAGEAVRDQALVDVLCQRAWSDTAWVRSYNGGIGLDEFYDVMSFTPAGTSVAAVPLGVPLAPVGGFTDHLRRWMTRYTPADVTAFRADLDRVAAGTTTLAAVTAAWLARHPDDRSAVLPDEVPRFAPFGTSAPGLPGPPADLLSALVLDAHLLGPPDPERAADLQRLTAVDPARLPLLTGGMLDLCSHRYDAWVTSIATARLSRLRAAGASGVHVGAYGWVDDFEIAPPDPSHWIHAPSLQHAATAAVLRAGYDVGHERALAVDLTSRRVRRAEWTLAGVRNGQPLGALAGYLVERELHERDLDAAVGTVRTLAPGPSSEGSATAGVGSGERVPGRVCDGLRLVQQLWADAAMFGHAVSDALRSAQIADITPQQVIDCVAIAADAVDAVGDLLLAESVHHAVGGNPLRAGVVADVMAGGADDVPDAFDIVRTPGSGVPVSHRIGVLLPAGVPAGDGWPAGRARGVLAPEVDAWCGLLLGPPRRWRFRRLGAASAPNGAVGLDDLGVGPLDVVFETAGEQSTLERRLLAMGADPADPAFDELCALTAQLRSVLARAQAVESQDGAAPVDDGAALDHRVTAALTAIATVLRRPALSRPDLVALADLGVAEAFPLAVDSDPAAQAGLLIAGLLPVVEAALTDADRATRLDALRRALGQGFPLFPSVAMPPDQLVALADPARPAAGDDPGEAIAAWIGEVAGVRDGVAAWERLALLAAALGGADVFAASQLLQLPLADADTWAAGAWQPRTPGGVGAGAWYVPHPLAAGGALGGFVVDRWTEVVPGQLRGPQAATPTFGPGETTAVAFSFDQPDARASQAVLVAVPPDPEAGWRLETVFHIVRETLDLARLRMIDPLTFDQGLFLLTPATTTFDVATATGLPFTTGLLAHSTGV